MKMAPNASGIVGTTVDGPFRIVGASLSSDESSRRSQLLDQILHGDSISIRLLPAIS